MSHNQESKQEISNVLPLEVAKTRNQFIHASLVLGLLESQEYSVTSSYILA